MVDTDSKATPEEALEGQLNAFVSCPQNGIVIPMVITASARTARSLLLRVSRKGMIAAPNGPGASETGVPGK
jgi:hypothetical protein